MGRRSYIVAHPELGILEVYLPNGDIAVADLADFTLLNAYRWRISHQGRAVRYARTTLKIDGKPKDVPMQVMLLGGFADHIDRDGLNNRRSNLRPATKSQNRMNTRPRIGTAHGLKGVRQCKKTKRWHARIHTAGTRLFLGSFATGAEAARAYDEAAQKYFREFAWLNFPHFTPPELKAGNTAR